MTEPSALIRELDQIRDAMVEGFAGVNQRLDRQNARIGTSEQQIAALNERTRCGEAAEPWWKQPAAIGAGSGGFFVALVEAVKAIASAMK